MNDTVFDLAVIGSGGAAMAAAIAARQAGKSVVLIEQATRRHLGAVPDDGREPADRGRVVPQRDAHLLLRLNPQPRSLDFQEGPLLS